MAYKCLTPETEKQIIEMYQTGKYSYQQIADHFFVSKSTVINIVKGYPYNKNKSVYYNRLQEESGEKLIQEIDKLKKRANEAHSSKDMASYGKFIRQWITLLDMASDKDHVYERLRDERTVCEQKAWEGFANSDYTLFGYNADTWELLTFLIGDSMKSPFKQTAIKINARAHSHSVKFVRAIVPRRNINFVENSTNSHRDISDESWKYISPIFNDNERGRPAGNRRIMNGIIYALGNCVRFTQVPSEYGGKSILFRKFGQWYNERVFQDLLEFVNICPELAAVRMELMEIEKFRLTNITIIPRLCDVRKGAKA